MQLKQVMIVAALIGLSAGVAWADDKAADRTKAKIGEAAPLFELKDSSGKTVKLADYKDKVVVLQWVNQECPFCRDALPLAKNMERKYAEKGVVWLAIESTNWRTAEQNEKWRRDKDIRYPVLMDTEGEVGHLYGAKTTPHVFVIDKGTLVYNGAIKEKDGERQYTADAIEAVLANKKVELAETKPYGCSVKYKK